MAGVSGATKLYNDVTKRYLRSVVADVQQQLEKANRRIAKFKVLLERERAKKEVVTSYSGDIYYNGISRAVGVLDNTANAGVAVKEAAAILRKTVKDVADMKYDKKYGRSRRNEDAIEHEGGTGRYEGGR